MRAGRLLTGLALVTVLAASRRTSAAQCVAPACTKLVDNGPDSAKKVIVVLGDGYASSDQAKYIGDVQRLVVDGVLGHDFFREDDNGFNVYRLNLVSTDSGVTQRVYDEHNTFEDASDDTITSTTSKNTALDYVWSGSWAHCWLEWGPNTGNSIDASLAANLDRWDYIVVILNQDSYGGCGGGGFQQVPRGVTWDVLAHEYGHGVGGLGDEYTGSAAYAGGAVTAGNCTTIVNKSAVYWNRFIGPTTSVPTTFGSGMDSNRTVGIFEGCMTKGTDVYRPVDNCRMRGNSPPFCPVCYTTMKKALYPFVGHSFSDVVSGDFNGDGAADVLIHNDQDIAIYTTNPTGHTLDFTWIANNIVPSAPGGNTWQPATHDQYLVADFDGDGKDDVYVFNGVDWAMPYLGLLRSDGTGLAGVARYDGSIQGFWQMTDGDTFQVGDFNGDHKADLFVFNGSNWVMPYLGMLRANGTSLSGITRYDGSIPGWIMKPADQYFAADFDGDAKSDLYVFNGTDWSLRYLGMVKSSATSLADIKLFSGALPGWTMTAGDRFLIGDFDGDRKTDLFVFNGTNWAFAYLLMAKSTGTGLSFTKRYDSSSSAANIPGWFMTPGDRFWTSDANKDGRTDLFVYNPAINWGTEYLGTLSSNGARLLGSWSANWVGGWNLGPPDKILVANYEKGKGKADIFIHNNEWLGLLRRNSSQFVMDRIYYHWIYTALYDSRPWSDSLP